MPRITQDPDLEVRPDFTSVAFDPLCTALATAEGIDKAAVAARLADAWVVDNNTRKEAWAEQVREDKAGAAEARLAQEAEELRELEELRKEEETEKREKEKKKPKLKGFVANKPVGNVPDLRPSRYAIHKLDERDYVELYYFTDEGCSEAVRFDRTIAQDAFTFAKADDTLLLKPMASHKPSSKVIPDEDLTWRQMSMAKTCLLHHMSQAGWPEELVIALAEFYLNLEGHPMRRQVDGDTVLLHYQAQVRREWHEALRATDDDDVFDISFINRQRVEEIAAVLWNTRRTTGVLRLEEQMAKTNLVSDSPRTSRAQGTKRGRSRSSSPEPRGQSSRHRANRSARRRHHSPEAQRQNRLSPPPKDAKRRRTAKSASDAQQSFQTGAAGDGALSACTICLGRHPHDVFKCASCSLWDGTPARCQKNAQGRIVNPAGNILCSDWQRPNGCSSSAHDSRHECSGCGKPTHGAQNCPRAQKA